MHEWHSFSAWEAIYACSQWWRETIPIKLLREIYKERDAVIITLKAKKAEPKNRIFNKRVGWILELSCEHWTKTKEPPFCPYLKQHLVEEKANLTCATSSLRQSCHEVKLGNINLGSQTSLDFKKNYEITFNMEPIALLAGPLNIITIYQTVFLLAGPYIVGN